MSIANIRIIICKSRKKSLRLTHGLPSYRPKGVIINVRQQGRNVECLVSDDVSCWVIITSAWSIDVHRLGRVSEVVQSVNGSKDIGGVRERCVDVVSDVESQRTILVHTITRSGCVERSVHFVIDARHLPEQSITKCGNRNKHQERILNSELLSKTFHIQQNVSTDDFHEDESQLTNVARPI